MRQKSHPQTDSRFYPVSQGVVLRGAEETETGDGKKKRDKSGRDKELFIKNGDGRKSLTQRRQPSDERIKECFSDLIDQENRYSAHEKLDQFCPKQARDGHLIKKPQKIGIERHRLKNFFPHPLPRCDRLGPMVIERRVEAEGRKKKRALPDLIKVEETD